MSKKKNRLKINICLIKGNIRRLNDNKKTVNSLHALAKKLQEESIINESLSSIYHRLYRYQLDGFYKKPQILIDRICKILQVTEEELIGEIIDDDIKL